MNNLENEDKFEEINEVEDIIPEIKPEEIVTENHKRGYVSDKEYVLYLAKGSEFPDGFISIKDSDLVLTEKIASATRMTSVEANRYAMEYHKKTDRYPFKLKITNYKNLAFF